MSVENFTAFFGRAPDGASAEDLRRYQLHMRSSGASASRLISCDKRGVIFKWKDDRAKGRERYKTMALPIPEFIRRFLIHVLPQGFHRIRYYGLFANGGRTRNIARARELFGMPAPEAARLHRLARDRMPPPPDYPAGLRYAAGTEGWRKRCLQEINFLRKPLKRQFPERRASIEAYCAKQIAELDAYVEQWQAMQDRCGVMTQRANLVEMSEQIDQLGTQILNSRARSLAGMKRKLEMLIPSVRGGLAYDLQVHSLHADLAALAAGELS